MTEVQATMTIDLPQKPAVSVISREVGGQLVLYDRQKDAVHTLNPTAQFVWERLNKTPDHIIAELQATYPVSSEVAQQDVAAILSQFRSLGLLQSP